MITLVPRYLVSGLVNGYDGAGDHQHRAPEPLPDGAEWMIRVPEVEFFNCNIDIHIIRRNILVESFLETVINLRL